MRRGLPVLLLLAACGGPVAGDTAPDEPLRVRTWVEGDASRGVGTLVVQVDAEAGLEVDLPDPEVSGLRFSEVDDAQIERVGTHAVTTRRFRFTGAPGSYEIPALSVGIADTDLAWSGASTPIWVDLGQPPPELDGFEDITDPSPVFRVTTAMIVGLGCLGLTGLGVIGGVAIGFFALNRGGRTRALPPEPPDVRALRQWDAIRTAADLDDHAKAVALAVLFREYVEAVFGFPATAWTTSEILRHLEGMAHLPDGNVGRARRILRATDRIKFADAAARATLFEELDDALRTFIGSTRPRTWQGES